MPRMPPSRMSRFEPPPRMNRGIACCRATACTQRRALTVSMRTRASTGPPMRMEVKGASGRAKSWRPGTSRSKAGRSHGVACCWTISGSSRGMDKRLTYLPYVPGTERQQDVVGTQIAPQEGDDLRALSQVVHLALALADQGLVEQPSGHPGQWRFTGGIDIEQHQRSSIVEGRAKL